MELNALATRSLPLPTTIISNLRLALVVRSLQRNLEQSGYDGITDHAEGHLKFSDNDGFAWIDGTELDYENWRFGELQTAFS